MERKFKKGDKVRIIKRKEGNLTGLMTGWDLPHGNEGEIGYVMNNDEGSTYKIHSQADFKSDDDISHYYGFFDEDDLVLITEKPKSETVDGSQAIEAKIEAARLKGMVEAYEKMLIGRRFEASA